MSNLKTSLAGLLKRAGLSRKSANRRGRQGTSILIRVDSFGWEVRVSYPDQEATSPRKDEVIQGDAGQMEERGPERLEKLLRMAVEAMPDWLSKDEGSVRLEMDAPGLAYADLRTMEQSVGESGGILSGGSGEKLAASPIHRYGMELLNVKDVCFGRCELPGTGALFGFVDSRDLGDWLAALDLYVPRLQSIVPVTAGLLGRVEKRAAVYAGLYVGGENTQVLLYNPALGAVQVRSLPVGVLTLAATVATRSGISATDALEQMAQQDYLQGIRTDLDGSEDGQLGTGPIEQALEPVLSMLLRGIRETLDFFTIHQACGLPERIELHGQAGRIKGLGAWIATSLVKGKGKERTPVGSVEQINAHLNLNYDASCLNLLEGLAQSELRIGKLRYSYVNQRLVVGDRGRRQASQPQSHELLKRAGQRSAPKRTSHTSRRSRSVSASGTSRMAGLLANFFGRGEPTSGLAAKTALDSETTRQYFLLSGVFFGALLFLAWDAYDRLDKRHRDAAVAYIGSLNENQQIQHELRSKASTLGLHEVAVAEDADKVLWTEKFLALGSNLNEHLWLTDVYLTEEACTVDQLKVLSKKLVIEGAALPSTRGHVAEIADYMQRLEADQAYFMSDFREISFDGSRLDEAEADRVVRFTLAAHYDENKRLESSTEHADKDEQKTGLGHTLQNVEQHNRMAERARKGDL